MNTVKIIQCNDSEYTLCGGKIKPNGFFCNIFDKTRAILMEIGMQFLE